MTISETFNEYERAEIRPAGMSNNTADRYYNTGRLFVDYMGDVNISDITIKDIIGFFEHLSTWQAPNTVRLNIISLRMVIKYCHNRGYSDLNYEDIKVPKTTKQQIEFLTQYEMDELFKVVSAKRPGLYEINRRRNIAMINVLYDSGIRVGELCRLNKNSIKDRTFTVIGKSKNPRICFITPKSEIAIDNYLQLRDDNEPALFISAKTGSRITADGVREVFKSIRRNSQFKNVHPHTIRHSFATKMLDRGVDIRYIADLMGHESLDTTRIYTHFTNPKLKMIYDKAQGFDHC